MEMSNANKIQIGMLGVIILMLGYMLFNGAASNNSYKSNVKAEAAKKLANLNDAQNPVTSSVLNQNNPVTTPPTPKKEEKPLPDDPKTSLTFPQMEHEFGTIKQGDKVEHTFKFKNTGKEPLIIYDAKASCGCTVPQKPDAPIAPGEEGEIKVRFDSKGKKGKQSPRVTVTANTEPSKTILKLNGEVSAPEGDPTTGAQPLIQPANQ